MPNILPTRINLSKKKIEKGKQRMKWIMLMMFVKKHFMMIEVCTTGWKFMSTRRAQQHVFKTIEIIFYWRGISTGWKNKSLSARQAGLLVSFEWQEFFLMWIDLLLNSHILFHIKHFQFHDNQMYLHIDNNMIHF